MPVTLENEHIKVSFTSQGIIENLVNKRTGHNYVTERKNLLGWKLVVPKGDWLDFPIEAINQDSRINACSSRVLIKYDHLKTSNGTVNINLGLEYTLHREQIHLRIVIENKSNVPISELWFPRLQGIHALGNDPTEDYLLLPERPGQRIQNPLAYLANNENRFDLTARSENCRGYNNESLFRISVYPGGYATMKWMGLFNDHEGIYIGEHSDSVETMSLYGKLRPTDETGSNRDDLEIGLIRYPFVKPGERYEFDSFVIALVEGDWHQGAKIYRKAVDKWYKPASPPDWIQNSNGWQIIIMKHQFGKVYRNYDDILNVYHEAQTGGISELMLWGWWTGGMDNRYPEYVPDEAMGGKDTLEENLREVQKRGGCIILYTQGKLIDPATSFYKDKGKKLAIRNRYGVEIRESYSFADEGSIPLIGQSTIGGSNQHPFVIACPNNKEWLDQMHRQTEIVRKLGANAVLWDQLAIAFPYLCFAKGHDHNKPAQSVGPGNLRNIREVTREVKTEDPEFAFIAEGVYDAMGQYIDMFYGNWSYTREYPAVVRGLKDKPRMATFSEMFRYTFPEIIITDRIIDVDSISEANWAFLLGMRFDVELRGNQKSLKIAPKLANYLKGLSNLRSKLDSYLLQGTFVDNYGFKIDNPLVLAKGFRSKDNRLAVVLWNATSQLQDVFLDMGSSRTFKEYSPDGSKTVNDEVIRLDANSIKVRVLSEKKARNS